MVELMPLTPPPSKQSPFPDEAFLSLPGVRALWTDRNLQRLLVRVRDVVLDSNGIALSARVDHVENFGLGPAWVGWTSGIRLCLDGLRVELLNTSSEGLHLRIGDQVRGNGTTSLDHPHSSLISGLHTAGHPACISTVRIDRDGLLVVSGDQIEPAYHVPMGHSLEHAVSDPGEVRLLRNLLVTRYGATQREVTAFLAGQGPYTPPRRSADITTASARIASVQAA